MAHLLFESAWFTGLTLLLAGVAFDAVVTWAIDAACKRKSSGRMI